MAMCGCPLRALTLHLIQPQGIGYIPNTDGHGLLIIHGGGLLSIMADGNLMPITDGSGYPTHNGARHGYRGEVAMVITDGLPWDMVMAGTTIMPITHPLNAGYLFSSNI